MSNSLILKLNISLLLTHNGVEHYRVGTTLEPYFDV